MMPILRIFRFLLLILTVTSFYISYCRGNGGDICHNTEMQALLSFKQYVIDPNNALLSSWNPQVDCCMWEHVVCDNLTGHVLELHLRGDQESRIYGSFDPSLTNLTHLRYLDLSMNAFEAAIPPFFGSFARLEYLNLSYAGFEGTIPHTLGDLSSLRTLGLRGWSPDLNVDSLEWLSRLFDLERLDMTGVWFNGGLNWEQGIRTLPSLIELYLEECNLQSISPPVNEVNFSSSLAILDLSDNHLQVAPTWISQLSNLTFLDLSGNNF